MADTDATLSRLGVVNAATPATWDDENALFLKVFAGEVFTAFEEKNIMKDMHRLRTITSGKSASFNYLWKANARYHTPGTAILGNNKIEANERVIKIDDLLIADLALADVDDAKNHYDVRQEYSKALGDALARAFDLKTMQVGVLAARATGNTASSPGGSQIKNTSAATDASILAGMIYDAAQTLDEKDVPDDERYVIFKPAQYYMLVQNTNLINKDWGGAGSYADGDIYRIADIVIKKSNNLPSTLVAAVTGENNTYNGDFSDTVGLVLRKDAIGTVKLRDLSVQMTSGDFNIMYQATLFVAKYLMGHGILRPECAIELSKAV